MVKRKEGHPLGVELPFRGGAHTFFKVFELLVIGDPKIILRVYNTYRKMG